MVECNDLASEAQVFVETVLGPVSREYYDLTQDFLTENSGRPVSDEELYEHVEKLEKVLDEAGEYLERFEDFSRSDSAYVASDSELWSSDDYGLELDEVERFYDDVFTQIYFITGFLEQSEEFSQDLGGVWDRIPYDRTAL